MTPNIVRLSIGLALIPFLPGMFFLIGVTFEKQVGISADTSLFSAYQGCAIIAVCAWTLMWRRSVRWTRSLVWWTVLSALPLLITPIIAIRNGSVPVLDALYKLSPILALGIWFAGTALIWRRPNDRIAIADDAKLAAPTCPTCEYNLTGLREVRCPECGWASTVDDIVLRHLARVASAD